MTEGTDNIPPQADIIFVAIMSTIVLAAIRYKHYEIKFKGKFRALRNLRFHTLELHIEKEIKATVRSTRDGSVVMLARLGASVPEYLPYDVVQGAHNLLLDWKHHAKLTIKHRLEKGHHVYDFHWLAYAQHQLEDHFSMADSHWYGFGHVFSHHYPMEKWDCNMGPAVTGEGDPFSIFGEYFGGTQERMWLTSTGIALAVEPDVPLFASINYDGNKLLKFVTKYSSPYQNNRKRDNYLQYSIIQAQDTRAAYLACAGVHFPLPTDIPDERMFRHPTWSTWAQYRKDLSEERVLDYGRKIRQHGFKDAQLEVDDDWTPRYGDWEFDENKFQDPKGMVKKLKEMGFRVTIWNHPFASPRSKAFWEGMKKENKWWVTWKFINFPVIVPWWNGYGAVLDLTNPDAVAWFEGTMRYLRTCGFDSFKLDAGEGNRLSSWTQCKEPMDNPNHYSTLFAELSYRSDPVLKAPETRVTNRAQNLPIFIRLQDKDSNWGMFNGLRTLIPHVLTQGLTGYQFVLPDMIGGNAYGILTNFAYPDKELFIRWTQCNALMPSMQFSVVPWQYDEQTVTIAREMCALHERYADRIIALAKEATVTGAPIVRPLWWIAPDDEVALTCSSEYLLGDDVLVAPVMEDRARSRDVYLPRGQWADELHHVVLKGGQWHRNFPAALDQLPHFTRLPE